MAPEAQSPLVQGTLTVQAEIVEWWKSVSTNAGVPLTRVLHDALDHELLRSVPGARCTLPRPAVFTIRVTEPMRARLAGFARARGFSASRFATLALRSALAEAEFPGPDALTGVPRGRGTRRERRVVVRADAAAMLRHRAGQTGHVASVVAEAALNRALESPSLLGNDAAGDEQGRAPGLVQNFRLPRGLIDRVDSEARRRGVSRSRLMAEALELELHRRGRLAGG